MGYFPVESPFNTPDQLPWVISIRLAHLQHLTYNDRGHRRKDFCDFWDFESCFNLPSLRHIRLSRVDLFGRMSTTPLLDNHFTEIYLHDSTWSVEAAEWLLHGSPRLRVLELVSSTVGNIDFGGELRDLEFPRLGRALCQYGTSLTRLTIDCYGSDGFENTENCYSLLGSLKELVNLRYLDVPMLQLLGPLSTDHFLHEAAQAEGDENYPVDYLWSLSDVLISSILPESIVQVILLNHRSRSSPYSIRMRYADRQLQL